MTLEKNSAMEALKEHIQKRTGLHLYEQDEEKFSRAIRERMSIRACASPEAYHRFLNSNHPDEWDILKIVLTSGESCFFRDKGQIELLQHNILPALIRNNRQKRELRLWSAGCSTGEEPYTLAMLIDQLLPQRQQWQIHIFGSDINEQALVAAMRGIYSRWTLRGVSQSMLDNYFSPHKNGWLLSPRIRDMVQFKQADLVGGSFPNKAAGLHEMDLILCRNLFIYYEGTAVAKMADKLINSLCQGGYLLTGHAEIPVAHLRNLHARIYPESVIYQRNGSTTPKSTAFEAPPSFQEPPTPERRRAPVERRRAPRTNQPRPVETTTEDRGTNELEKAREHLRQGSYNEAVAAAQSILERAPDNTDAMMIAANAYANMGKNESAEQFCRQAMAAAPLDAEPYYLMAQLSQIQNHFSETRQLLNKVIYLSPDFVPAYLELAAICDREGSTALAHKMRSSAMEILKRMPPDTVIPEYETISAKQLLEHVQGMLK